jgi:hypothetical protein
MIVRDEDLDVKHHQRYQATMDKVFEFIGLCPFKLPKMKPTLKSTLVMSPSEYAMSQEMEVRLTTFFRPFTVILNYVFIASEIFHHNRRSLSKSNIIPLNVSLSTLHGHNLNGTAGAGLAHWIVGKASSRQPLLANIYNASYSNIAAKKYRMDLLSTPTWFEKEDAIFMKSYSAKSSFSATDQGGILKKLIRYLVNCLHILFICFFPFLF